jgi:putative phage-type endonuclease
MNQLQWLHQRHLGLGGSDAAAALGLSPWKTRRQLWEEKTSDCPPTLDSELMLWGRLLEPVIRQQYAERTGRSVYVEPYHLLRHVDYPWMIANLDGFTDDGRVLEIKTARTDRDWGEPGSVEIPLHYLLQVQHYLAIVKADWADVVVLIGGNELRIYPIPADAELKSMLISQELEFWQYVLLQKPPEPLSYAEIQQAYGRTSKVGKITASAEAVSAVAKLQQVRQTLDALKVEREQLQFQLMRELGELDTLVDPNGKTLATWKQTKASNTIDWQIVIQTLQTSHPDLATELESLIDQHTLSKPGVRRFLLK